MPPAPSGVRRGTLADVAPVARLMVPADHESWAELPALRATPKLSAPELALRLLEDLDDGHAVYVAERDGRVVGYADVGGLMVGDGGHLVELRGVYVAPEHRRRGLGRQLLALIVRDLRQRGNAPSLRAWAATGSAAGDFMEAAGGLPTRQRWKVGPAGVAVRGTVFDWSSRPRAAAGALA